MNESMTREQILKTIEDLSHSQGFYSRLYAEIKRIEVEEPEEYELYLTILERYKFKDPVDLILFFES